MHVLAPVIETERTISGPESLRTCASGSIIVKRELSAIRKAIEFPKRLCRFGRLTPV